MKLALFSDIHANLPAWQACLAHAKMQGFDQIAVMGDMVGYGATPAEIVDAIQCAAADGALVVKGNHDALAVEPPRNAAETMDQSAAIWTHEQLDPGQIEFLAALPLTLALDDILFVHASVDAPERWRYVDRLTVANDSIHAAATEGAHYVVGGHVHRQLLYYRGAGKALMPFEPTAGVAIPVPPHRTWLLTCGSVGQPRDGRPEAMYAIFDTGRHSITFHRVAYDHIAAAAAIRAVGLPEFFASRLEVGL